MLKLIGLFNPKIKLFVKGRQETFSILKKHINPNVKTFWIHAASLGEFEQGRPIIEAYKKAYPDHQILVTFFSPSGYEIRKNYELATAVCYLPMDNTKNVAKFIKLVNPNIAVFIKYEFWPNFLYQLRQKQIPIILISSIFREQQIFFKPIGFWMKKHLFYVNHFFVQDQQSCDLLNSINIQQCSVAGDTRFDRVNELIKNQQKLTFVETFKNNQHLLVAGSTWKEDEELLVNYINNQAQPSEKFIIVPHNIHKNNIEQLQQKIQGTSILYSQFNQTNLKDIQVLIIDSIGLLSAIYAYATVAYIGGGYNKSGVHNTLEAATYGIPIVIGPNYQKFKEVKDLIKLNGIISTHNQVTLNQTLLLLKDSKTANHQGLINKKYVEKNLGATQKIMQKLSTLC